MPQRHPQTPQSASSSTASHTDALTAWIDATIRPNAFVTILLPIITTPRPHEFYLSLWTRQAEAALWGKSALHIANHADRCLWLFVHETNRQDWTKRFTDSKPRKLHHYHALLRMPMFSHQFRGTSRPMLEEHHSGRMLPLTERCSRMRGALIEASKRTPEPYATSALDHLRGADIDVRPYRPEHTPYIFKQLMPRFHEHWTEQRPDDRLVRDHGLFILPHLPYKKEKHTCPIPNDKPNLSTSDFVADRTSSDGLLQPHERTNEASQAGFGRS